jgi:FKBP-type peptidyl-prolyl cis-trans isomerase FklB
MKSQWLGLICLGVTALHAAAQQLDVDPLAAANAAAKAQAVQSRHPSPRQQLELDRAAMGEKNRDSAAQFLTNNRSRRGVTSLADGLQYRVLQAGHGPRPGDGDTVQLRYQGALADGSVFEQSDERQPAALRVSGLVPGLREAVTLMPAGSRWEVVIPPQLAYGARGNRVVGPNAVLVYTIEVLGVR